MIKAGSTRLLLHKTRRLQDTRSGSACRSPEWNVGAACLGSRQAEPDLPDVNHPLTGSCKVASVSHLCPLFFQTHFRNRDCCSQFLCKQRDAKLFQHPAVVLQFRIVDVAFAMFVGTLLI